MTCPEFATMARDAARGNGAASEIAAAMDHCAACEVCAQRLEAERRLDVALSALAAEPANAPEYLERALASSFRRHHRGPVRPGAWRVAAWAGAAIAAALIVTALLPGRARTPGPSEPSARLREEPQSTPPVEDAAAPAVPKKRNYSSRRYARPLRRPVVEDGRGFLPVLYGAEVPQSGTVVRVTLPRSALISFGLPMNELRSGDRVQADVLIGDDGVARAVRFRP